RFDPWLTATLDTQAKVVLTTQADGTLRLYSFPAMKQKRSYKLPGVAHYAAYDPKKHWLYVAAAIDKAAKPSAQGRYGKSDLLVFEMTGVLDGTEKNGSALKPLKKIATGIEVAGLVLALDFAQLHCLDVTSSREAKINTYNLRGGPVIGQPLKGPAFVLRTGRLDPRLFTPIAKEQRDIHGGKY